MKRRRKLTWRLPKLDVPFAVRQRMKWSAQCAPIRGKGKQSANRLSIQQKGWRKGHTHDGGMGAEDELETVLWLTLMSAINLEMMSKRPHLLTVNSSLGESSWYAHFASGLRARSNGSESKLMVSTCDGLLWPSW